MNNTIKVYSDASYSCNTKVASVCCILIDQYLQSESFAEGYKTTINNINTHELYGIYNSISLALRYIKRKRYFDKVIFIYCDNLSSIQSAVIEDKVVIKLDELRERGCNVVITYINGDDPTHLQCHYIASKYRKMKEVEIVGDEFIEPPIKAPIVKKPENKYPPRVLTAEEKLDRQHKKRFNRSRDRSNHSSQLN